jgi:hypothetical protein
MTGTLAAADDGAVTYEDRSPASTREAHPKAAWRTALLAGGLYLVLAIALWWRVWSSHPTSVATCGCGDASLFTWFLEWPAYALTHGHNPFFSTAMFYPQGVNLLSNTSELAFGLVLAPLTWLFGPIFTLNVALTLSPVLSALAMFVLVRRWVNWLPAAFVAGMAYGFSPYVLSSLTVAHLMDAMVAVPPLIALCLDEILLRQRRRPFVIGIQLGALIVVQFFIGTEMLAITAITAGMGLVLIVTYALIRCPSLLRSHARGALVGLGTASAVAAVSLAYPAWYALSGRARLAGRIWPSQHIGRNGFSSFGSYVIPHSVSSSAIRADHLLYGYQGIPPSTGYWGGALVVVVGGLVLWRRDLRLWFFAVLAVLAADLSLASADGSSPWALWRYFDRRPILQNVIQVRFDIMVGACVAVLIGLIVDRTHSGVLRHLQRESRQGREPLRFWEPLLAAAGVTAVALLPMELAVASVEPMAAAPVHVPLWFTTAARHLPGRQVVLVYPAPFGGVQSAMTWQAVGGLSFTMVGAGGPGAIPQRAGIERAGFDTLSATTLSFSQFSSRFTTQQISGVRRALLDWGVTTIVVPDQPRFPRYELGSHTAVAVALFTASTGNVPRFVDRAWVWTAVNGRQRSITPDAFRSCVGFTNFAHGPSLAVPRCVESHSTPIG